LMQSWNHAPGAASDGGAVWGRASPIGLCAPLASARSGPTAFLFAHVTPGARRFRPDRPFLHPVHPHSSASEVGSTRVRATASKPNRGPPPHYGKHLRRFDTAACPPAPMCPHEAARGVRLTNNERTHHDRKQTHPDRLQRQRTR
jgi:hypothetical protein